MEHLLQRYKELCPDFRQSVRIFPALRINTLKISEEQLVKRLKAKNVLLEKIPFLKHGYHGQARFSLGSTPEYLQGYYYLQEAASQIPSEVLLSDWTDEDCKQNCMSVLDMCCAPGSKITHLSQIMNNKGTVVGLDIEDSRLGAARNNAARMGCTNTLLYKLDAAKCADLGVKFDRVLLDAPCSGNYCVEHNFFRKRRLKDFENRARLQKRLLKAGLAVLKKGGILLYSTCSLEPEENEMVIVWAIREHNVRVLDTGLKVGDPGMTNVFGKEVSQEIKKCRRFWPHKTKTQGFFVAKLTI